MSKCIPAPANWSLSSIPRALEEDHVRRIHERCDRTTVNGCRDYAIILLLERLGLRAGEVAALHLEVDNRAVIESHGLPAPMVVEPVQEGFGAATGR